VSYEATNRTDRPRSIDALQIMVSDANGTEADCLFDDSSGFGPLEETRPNGGQMGEDCVFAVQPTLPVTVSYDGVSAALAELSPSAQRTLAQSTRG
jgi:hypothetical protein